MPIHSLEDTWNSWSIGCRKWWWLFIVRAGLCFYILHLGLRYACFWVLASWHASYATHRICTGVAVDTVSIGTQTCFCTYCKREEHPDYPSRISLIRQLNAGLQRHKNSPQLSHRQLLWNRFYSLLWDKHLTHTIFTTAQVRSKSKTKVRLLSCLVIWNKVDIWDLDACCRTWLIRLL